MKKANPIWQELPVHFKKDVVDHLDLKARHSLRQCSRSDQDLVSSTPIYLDRLALCPPNRIILYEKYHPISGNNLVEILFQIFNHPKSFVENLEFYLSDVELEDEVEIFLQAFLSRARSEPSFKINSSIFCFDSYRGNPLGAQFLEILKLVDTKNLKTLRIAPEISNDFKNQIFETEQWRNAKELRIFGLFQHNIDLEPYLKFEKLNLQAIQLLRSGKAWDVIRNYLNRDLPLFTSFEIRSMMNLQIDTILTMFTVPVRNQPIDTNTEYHKHTQIFELPNKENVFVVKIMNRGICGAVCRKGHMEKDYRWAINRVRIQD